MASRKWKMALQFGIQFAKFFVSTKQISVIFNVFPHNFQNENIMFFRGVAFLNAVDRDIGYSTIRFQSEKMKKREVKKFYIFWITQTLIRRCVQLH